MHLATFLHSNHTDLSLTCQERVCGTLSSRAGRCTGWVLIPVCSPEVGTHTAAMVPCRGQGACRCTGVLFSADVDACRRFTALKNGHHPLPQGSRYPLTPNSCWFCLPNKVLSVFLHPNPSCSLSGHCHDQLSSADVPIQAASFFFEFTYLYFSFSASSMPDTEMRRHCRTLQSSICPPKILTVLLRIIFVHFPGPGFTLNV